MRYLVEALPELLRTWTRSSVRVEPLALDLRDGATARRIDEGGTPFRVYSTAWFSSAMPAGSAATALAVDLGCGSGGLAHFVGDRARYLGLDLAAKPAWMAGSGRHFAAASAEALPLVSGSVDVILSSSALEHIESLPAALAESARVLRIGGRALHAVPAPWSLALYLLHGYRRFAPDDLERITKDAGLRLDALVGFGGLPSFALHFALITVPELILRRDVRQSRLGGLYRRALRVALRLDPWLPWCRVAYGALITRVR